MNRVSAGRQRCSQAAPGQCAARAHSAWGWPWGGFDQSKACTQAWPVGEHVAGLGAGCHCCAWISPPLPSRACAGMSSTLVGEGLWWARSKRGCGYLFFVRVHEPSFCCRPGPACRVRSARSVALPGCLARAVRRCALLCFLTSARTPAAAPDPRGLRHGGGRHRRIRLPAALAWAAGGAHGWHPEPQQPGPR